METAQAINISVTITRPFEDVYAFVAELQNFPIWAAGVGKLRRKTAAHEWLVETLSGQSARLRMTPKNNFGVADHFVFPEDSDEEIYVPLRVLRNLEGSEVVFTLFRMPGMDDAQFKADETLVRKDLDALKKHLEA